jgi:hypothetical protein
VRKNAAIDKFFLACADCVASEVKVRRVQTRNPVTDEAPDAGALPGWLLNRIGVAVSEVRIFEGGNIVEN